MATQTQTSTPAPKVTSPVKAADGVVKLYVHDSTSGPIGLIYRPANAVEAMEYAMSLCPDTATLDSVLDIGSEFGVKRAAALKLGTPTVQAPATVTVPTPAPAPAPVKAPTTGLKPFDLSALQGMDAERAGRWMASKATQSSVEALCQHYGMAPATVVEYTRQLAAIAAGKPVAPAPAPVVKAPAPAPADIGLPPCYEAVHGMTEDGVKALCGKLGVAVGTSMNTTKALLWNAIVDARQAADKAPAPVVAVAKQAPVVKATGTVPMPDSYKALLSLGADGVKSLATTLGVTLPDTGKFTAKAGLVWNAIQAKGTPAPVVVAAQVAPAPVVKAPAPTTYKAGMILVADGKGGVKLATEADIFSPVALEQYANS
jgi:hypothetical protein